MDLDLAGLPASQLYVVLAEKHGHYCPMSTLGLRIGWAARALLPATPFEAIYLARTCAVDGITLALDLPALAVEEQGEHRLLLRSATGIWQLSLLPRALQLAGSYRHLATEADREGLLESLRCAKLSELLEVEMGEGA